MLNMEHFISKISTEVTKSNGEICMSKIDLDYAYGQAKLSKEASKYCVFSIIGGDFIGNYCFKKGFYGLSNMPTVFQEYIDKGLEIKTTEWLDDIICVTNGIAEEHEREQRGVLSKLEKAGYRTSKKKTDFFKQINVAWFLLESERRKTNKRQNRIDYKNGSPEERERARIIPGFNPTPIQIYKHPIEEDRQNEHVTEEGHKMGIDS